MEKEQKKSEQIVAAFESWSNGRLQTSAFYVGKQAREFVESHYNAGTFASLHTFTDVNQGKLEYENILNH
jgi:hypothetical protein